MATTLAADQGSFAASGSAPVGQPAVHGGMAYGPHNAYGPHQYTSQYNGNNYAATGAGESTMWIMLAVVMASYCFMAVLMMFVCFARPRYQTQYVEFVDMEAEPTVPPGMEKGPVAQLDKQWRKAFISKVYTILVVQIAVTFLISFSMMQFG